MDIPICFSQYFMNKQNVRSFQNIFNINLFKSAESEEYIQNVLQDSVSEISQGLRDVLNTLRINILKYCQQDFKEVFEPPGQTKILCPVDKGYIFNGCSSGLFKIIPKALFGNNHNLKIFQKCLKTIVYSMRKQHLIFTMLIKKWNYNVGLWTSFELNIAQNILISVLVWVFKNILSAIICLNFYVTTCKIDADENKLHYFWKYQWQSFYDKEINKLLVRRAIRKYEPYCLGKKVKKRLKSQQCLAIKNIRRDIPKLHLILKPNNEVRPIVRYKNGILSISEKYKIKEKLLFLKFLSGQGGRKLETQFVTLHSDWLKRNKPKLYFIKADLRNAFGSINKSLLKKIISEKMEDFKKENSYYFKKFSVQYKELLAELQKPIYVRAGSTIFTWQSGLVQGYVYSPALSELYYSYLDKLYFSEHLEQSENQLKLFTRIVDDYLYITDCLDDAYAFINALSNYKNVNYDKTAVNFEYPGINYSDVIQFVGYTYNTQNLIVNRARNIYAGHMCYKITFSQSISNINTFLESRIGQTGIPINSLLFNLNNIDEEILWRNIFVTFCISANKFCTILSILCEDMLDYLPIYKRQVSVKLSNSIIKVLSRNKPNDYMFMYCINHFRYLSYKALLLCAKKTPKCCNLVSHINVELSKCNCLFGKWRDHASRISRNGDSQKPAIQIICRRTDLRRITKTFEDLPTGFECYKNMYEV
ncbi:uncharacterized protein LOC125054308 [Pieris napi]|uniref:uncharacterized protein LOC125054308 n=1 Tax=Pieris napi TaxID=78633 RepID=UPI001FB946B0|nr:uncharacterized protein LOC125054308 [Pieris napi]